VFLPDIIDEKLGSCMITGARFFNPTTSTSNFTTTNLRISRLTSTHLVYATSNELVRATFGGSETFRIPLALATFEISSNGARLIGALDGQGTPRIVHVTLATGAVTAPFALDSAFWNLAAAPGGRFTLATTKKSVYLFDSGAFSRRVDLPVNWTVSADVADSGAVAIGAQLANHAAELLLVGPPGSGTSITARTVETDGYRPYVKFSPNGQRLMLNETGAVSVFDISRAP
jgi:hypothetical protein